MKFRIPIRLPSLANLGGGVPLRTRIRMKKDQRYATWVCITAAKQEQELPPLPVVVTITRIGPRRLDDDNLAAACKYVRDEVADALGEDDGSPLYTWKYEQRTGGNKEYAAEVEILPR